EAALALGQAHAVDAPALLDRDADGVRELDLAALARARALQRVEDGRREHVAAGDGQLTGRVLRARLLHDVRHLEDVAFSAGPRDAVVPHLAARHALEGHDRGRLLLHEALDHAPHD